MNIIISVMTEGNFAISGQKAGSRTDIPRHGKSTDVQTAAAVNINPVALKEASNAIIQSEKGNLKRQIRSIQTGSSNMEKGDFAPPNRLSKEKTSISIRSPHTEKHKFCLKVISCQHKGTRKACDRCFFTNRRFLVGKSELFFMNCFRIMLNNFEHHSFHL